MSTYTPSAYTQAVTAEVWESMLRRDMTDWDLADLTGIGLKCLQNRLACRAPWNVEQLHRIALALEVDMRALVDVEETAA